MSRFHDEFFGQKGPQHDALVIKCVSNDGLQQILESLGLYAQAKIKYETEVICKSGQFIIGYADIYIQVFEDGDCSDDLIEKRARRLINDFRLPEAEAYRSARRSITASSTGILVECKPSVADFGAVIRQLKTYEDILKSRGAARLFKVIATYSTPTKQVLDYLSHEDIVVVVFEEGT